MGLSKRQEEASADRGPSSPPRTRDSNIAKTHRLENLAGRTRRLMSPCPPSHTQHTHVRSFCPLSVREWTGAHWAKEGRGSRMATAMTVPGSTALQETLDLMIYKSLGTKTTVRHHLMPVKLAV